MKWIAPDSVRSGMVRVTRTARALGTEITLTVLARDEAVARVACEAAFVELDRIEDLLSLYRPESQISRLNRDGVVTGPAPELLQVLREAGRLSVLTGGVFDITVQPLWKLYADHAAEGSVPSPREISDVVSRVNWRNVSVRAREVRLHGAGTQITLNGIAQGYAADAVGTVLRRHGIHHALIDTGEIGTLGHPAARDAWTIGIKHPRKAPELLGLARLDGRCLATSGDYESMFTGDFRHHHLLDPRTGASPGELSSVSVAAPTALAADGYSTALFLLGIDQGRELVASSPGIDALFVTKEGRIERTDGFPRFSARP